MSRREARIARLAESQHGVVSIDQLERVGLSPSAVHKRTAAGRLFRVHRRVYAVGHRKLTQRGRLMAAALAYGPEALVSHLSALSLQDLRPDNRTVVDVTVPRWSVRSRPGIRAHACRTLAPADRVIADGIPSTSVARAVLDSAPRLGYDRTLKVLERAEVLRTFDLAAFEELLGRTIGHPGAGVLRRALDDLGEPSPTENDFEAAVLALVNDAGLPAPVCQAPVRLDGQQCRIDFLWPLERIALEADGYEFHGTRQAFERDRRRDQLLALAGYEPVRITWRQLTRAPHEIEQMLRALLRDRREARPEGQYSSQPRT